MEDKYPQKGHVGASGGEMYNSAIAFWVNKKDIACVTSVPYIHWMYVCIIVSPGHLWNQYWLKNAVLI